MGRYRNTRSGTLVSTPDSITLGAGWELLPPEGEEAAGKAKKAKPAAKPKATPDESLEDLIGDPTEKEAPNGGDADAGKPSGRGAVPAADADGNGTRVRRRAAAKG